MCIFVFCFQLCVQLSCQSCEKAAQDLNGGRFSVGCYSRTATSKRQIYRSVIFRADVGVAHVCYSAWGDKYSDECGYHWAYKFQITIRPSNLPMKLDGMQWRLQCMISPLQMHLKSSKNTNGMTVEQLFFLNVVILFICNIRYQWIRTEIFHSTS